MRSITNVVAAALLLAATCAAPQARAAALVLDLEPGGTTGACAKCGSNGTTFGYSFTVTSPITVDGIGIWNSDSPLNTAFSTEAGLYIANTGKSKPKGKLLLASVTITSSSPAVASANPTGDWLVGSIAPVTLTPGDYAVGEVVAGGPILETNVSYTTIPEVTVDSGLIGSNDGGLTNPTTSGQLVFGPTLELAVPEPATWAMLMLGIGAMGAMLRRRRGALAPARS